MYIRVLKVLFGYIVYILVITISIRNASASNSQRKGDTYNSIIEKYQITLSYENTYSELSNKLSKNSIKNEDTLALMVDLLTNAENSSINLMNSIISFCNKNPNDERIYMILISSLSGNNIEGRFWKNIPSSAKQFILSEGYLTSYNGDFDWYRYEKIYEFYGKMLPKIYSYMITKEGYEQGSKSIRYIKKKFMERFLFLSRNTGMREKGKADLEKIHALFLQAAYLAHKTNYTNEIKKIESNTSDLFNTFKSINFWLLSAYHQFGWNDDDIRYFINKTDTIEYPGLVKWAWQWDNILNLKKQPLELEDTTLDGRTINIKNFSGKVVLIDFWSLSCSSCIGRMPYLRSLYKKYKNQGFEILSVCTAAESGPDRVKVVQVESSIKGEWSTIITGNPTPESKSTEIWDKYGFYGVPQLMLLDREGKLILLNDILVDADFEQFLQSKLL